MTKKVQECAKQAFLAIGGEGISRIDLMIDEDSGELFVNEINTIPGSLSFYLWEATDLKYPELIDKLISLAFKRQRDRENLMFTIDTNILNESSFGAKGSKGKI